MTTMIGALTLTDVSVGDELPPLAYDVTATTVVLGALAMRDWRPMHHDYKFATERNGVKDIFLNTPNQAGWIERYLTDWTGPNGRLTKLRFKMKRSICAGDVLRFDGEVTGFNIDLWERPERTKEALQELASRVAKAFQAVAGDDRKVKVVIRPYDVGKSGWVSL